MAISNTYLPEEGGAFVHPLSNLPQQIEERRILLIDPTKGTQSNFGAYFHGYGKGLVKGASLRFQKVVTESGEVTTELSFRVNHFYLSRLKTQIQLTKAQVLELHRAFNYTVQADYLTPMNDLVKTSGWYVGNSNRGSEVKEGIFILDLKPFLTTKAEASVEIKGIGSIEVNGHESNTVRVSLRGSPDIRAFQTFLAVFGLEEVLTPSTPEELEKIKLGFIFKFFFPGKAWRLQQYPTFATLSYEQLKECMIEMAPSFEQYLQQYPVQTVEMLPGYLRYSLPIDAKVQEAGARALTAKVEVTEKVEFASTRLDKLTLRKLAHTLKNGVLSPKLEKADLRQYRGETSRIYTQIVWKRDLETVKKGDVRLYFALTPLNRGSNQYNRALVGQEDASILKHRKNIVEFVSDFPFGKKEARKEHEVMVQDRIFPEEIIGMSVPNEAIRTQIVAHLRQHGIIRDEAINGIPILQFIAIGHKVPASVKGDVHD
jgi:hypothetical protein